MQAPLGPFSMSLNWGILVSDFPGTRLVTIQGSVDPEGPVVDVPDAVKRPSCQWLRYVSQKNSSVNY
jgi:hypothetical protein